MARRRQGDISTTEPVFDSSQKGVIPGYTILDRIGKGASGIVYSARDNKSAKQVAIKVFYLHYCRNKEFVRRLVREAETIKKLKHPNIVAGLGYGTYHGYYYSIMEFVKGETLKAILKREKRLDEHRAAEIMLGVAKALDAANKKGIIHRDIKPSNIIITPRDGVKLADFGLAREELDTSLTLPGLILGTPLYISPEQGRGEKKIDIRSDLYALGITFFHLVVGQPPFVELNTSLLLTKKITDDVPSPALMNSALSPAICAIILKLCQCDPVRRYANPSQLIFDLKQYLTGEFEVDATRILEPKKKRKLRRGEIEKILKTEVRDETLQGLLQDKPSRTRPRLLGPFEILFYEDGRSRETYVLLKGEIEILKAGRRVAVINTPGTFIGEMSTLLQTRRTATVRSLTRAILLEVPEETFQQFLHSAPQMAYNLARSLASRLNKTTIKLKEMQGHLAAIREHYRLIKDELEGD